MSARTSDAEVIPEGAVGLEMTVQIAPLRSTPDPGSSLPATGAEFPLTAALFAVALFTGGILLRRRRRTSRRVLDR